jgi:hypothetical protein
MQENRFRGTTPMNVEREFSSAGARREMRTPRIFLRPTVGAYPFSRRNLDLVQKCTSPSS